MVDKIGAMDWKYFWKQQDDIPAGMGYQLFGSAHLISVAVTICIVIAGVMLICKRNMLFKKRVVRIIPLLMVALEVFKDLFLVSVGRFGIGYLPLHVCSIGIFVFVLREYLPFEWSKVFFGEISFVLIMPASLAALFFADWTVYYPVFNFMNLYSYLWHGLLILYPVLLYVMREVRPEIRHFHYVLLFLIVIVPLVYAFDKRFNCNYFFVNWPAAGSPLEWCEAVIGNPGYILGYGVMVLVAMLMVYGIIFVIEKIGEKIDDANR